MGRQIESFCCFFVLLCFSACVTAPRVAPGKGPWNVGLVKTTPSAQWGSRTGLVQEVYYQGENYQGKPTRIFAYLGRPAEGNGPFPAMLLVHGGGGKAFRDWADHW